MKVVVGISGGVDSAVSAYLLKSQGYEVEGLFIKSWEPTSDEQAENTCSFKEDYESAKQVAEFLGIKLRFADFTSEYWENVFQPSIAMYSQGLTPNPDIYCNKYVKFDVMYRYALQNLGADKFATGHYANVEKHLGKNLLRIAKDQKKDQTYFLCMVASDQLENVIFPLGNMLKTEVKELANNIAFPNATRKESMGICFIGKQDFKDFLSQFIEPKNGLITDSTGKELGTHIGACYYTLGQRTGLHIGGVKGAQDKPWFVVKKNIEKNVLIVSQNEEDLWGNSFFVKDYFFNLEYNEFINDIISVRIRHNGKKTDCKIHILESGVLRVDLLESERAITGGQIASFYWNNYCVGGGVIV